MSLKKSLLLITLGIILAISPLASFPIPAQAQFALPVPRDQTVITEIMSSVDLTIFDSANPYLPSGTQWGSGWHQMVMEWDWYINYATGETIYWRVTGWEYNDDYTTFTYHIRKGVTWNDGYPFTARDHEFTIDMVMANEGFGGYAYLHEWVDSVETAGDYTLIIHLKKPNPRFHHTFRMWSYLPYVAPEHLWKDVDLETFKNWPPVDTGPYKLYDVYPEQYTWIWERRDDYWAKEIGVFPAPKYAVWRGIPPLDLDLEDFVRGDVDVVLPHTFTWESVVTAMERTPNVTIAPYTDPCPYGINSFNTAKYPYSIPEFRWAVAYLLDRDRTANAYALSDGTPTTDWLLPMPYSWAIFDEYRAMAERGLARIEDELGFTLEYNPDKAKEILDSLGFLDADNDGWRELPNGTDFTVELLLGEDAAHYIGYDLMEELRAIGVDATTRIGGALTGQLSERGEYDIRICTHCSPGWIMGDPVPSLDVFHSKWYAPIGNSSGSPGIQGANPRYVNPDLDVILDELWEIPLDHPDAPALIEEAIYIIQRDCITVPAIEKTFVQTFGTTYWTGWPSEDNYYIVPYNWWPYFFLVYDRIKPVREPVVVTTVTDTVTEVVTTTETQAAQTFTETETISTVDMTSVAGAGVVALVVGVVVGWLVGSKRS